MLQTRTRIGELYKVRVTAVHSLHEFFVQLDSRETAAALESISHELLNLDNFVCAMHYAASTLVFSLCSQLNLVKRKKQTVLVYTHPPPKIVYSSVIKFADSEYQLRLHGTALVSEIP